MSLSINIYFQACLFVAVSPDPNNHQESLTTLGFGSGARQVELGQAKKNVRNRRKSSAIDNNLGAWDVQEEDF